MDLLTASAVTYLRSQAVIFDFDGVLLDTEPLYTEAISRVLAPHGKVYDWALKRRMMGRSDVEGARLLISELALALTQEEYLEQREPILEGLFATAPAMPGAPELLAELARLRVPLAIGTSSRSNLFAIKAQRHTWLHPIQVVVCGDDPEVKAFKPAPDIFLVAAQRLGIAPERCVVVEDSPAGVLAGKNAGMRVVALPAPELGDADVQAADVIAKDARSLREALLGFLNQGA